MRELVDELMDIDRLMRPIIKAHTARVLRDTFREVDAMFTMQRCPVCEELVQPTPAGRCPKCGDVVIVEVE